RHVFLFRLGNFRLVLFARLNKNQLSIICAKFVNTYRFYAQSLEFIILKSAQFYERLNFIKIGEKFWLLKTRRPRTFIRLENSVQLGRLDANVWPFRAVADWK